MALRFHEPYEAHWHPEAFSKMCNLKLLILSSDHWSQPIHEMKLSFGLKCLPSALKVVQWWGYPLESLPLQTPLDELVDVSMQYSKIKQLWNGIKCLGMLKFLDFSHSKYLIETPNFSGVPNLERLILQSCTSLVKVHPSLGELKKLVLVNLRDCKTLKILPRKLEMNSLKDLVLGGCSKIAKLPEFGKSMKDLISIDLEDTVITELPESLEFLTGLRDLNLNGCKKLVCLPHTFHKLKHLRTLTLQGCLEFSKLPENLNENSALEDLDVSGTSIKEVPLSIFQLRNLKAISYDGSKLSSSNSWSLSHILWKIFGRHPIPMWLWRIVGLVSSLIGEIAYGLSSSFKHLCGEWKWWKIIVYSLLSFMICSVVLFVRRARQRWKTLLVKAHVAFVILMASSLYSYVYDKFMSGKSNAIDLISSGAFALMSLSLSRLSEPGFEAGVFNFLLGFLTQQLMKNNFVLVLAAAGVCYFFILVRCLLESHFQPRTEIARLQVRCSINSIVDLENESDDPEVKGDDRENQYADRRENEDANDLENESEEDLENKFVDPENEIVDLENEGAGNLENKFADSEKEIVDLENVGANNLENEVYANRSREIERDYQVRRETETARIQHEDECIVNIVDPENEASLNLFKKRRRECQIQAETETERGQDQCVVNIVNTR
ncbi:TMV resistance protein N-like [Senna tora]|uniref:TMV resistance protein N-like n=1 Tax=Senna tora TaxID=362788 RepID=A0A834WVW0_9FABA|nr:TMV resistance protein N-like [Senna tora]